MDVSRTARSFAIPLAIVSVGLLVTGARIAAAKHARAQVRVDRGTNIAATVSPDRSAIVFDLQGVLWSIPMAGGAATALTPPLLEPARPDYSPKEGSSPSRPMREAPST